MITSKWEGPFCISKVLGPLTYQLKLPEQWKIHPIFHTTLLTPFKENNIHRHNYINPPPDLIDGEPEYEIEAINAHRRQGRGYLYLVKWKGYYSAENTWEPEQHLSHAQDILKSYKDQHHLHWKLHLFKQNQSHMPHITELDLSEENKENIPPLMLHDNLSNLVDYFDSKFKEYEGYSTYFYQKLPKWISKPTFKLFDAYYCQHRFLLQQKRNYYSLLLHTQRMLDSTNSMNRVQTYHAQQTIPKLLEEGFGTNLFELEYPERSSPIRQPKPSVCPTCWLPYVYDHIAWCRELTDGYTCRYNLRHHLPPYNLNQLKISLKNHTVSYAAATNIWYQCCICHQRAPGHQVINCPELLGRGSTLVKKDDCFPVIRIK